MKCKKRYFWLVCIIVVVIFYGGGDLAQTKLTYLEFKNINTDDSSLIQLKENGDCLIQDFIAPYDILHGISIQIGTYMRCNNSKWQFEVREKKTGKVLYQNDFRASLIVDNAYELIELNRNLKIKKGEKYQFVIKALDVREISSLAFYTSKTSTVSNSDLLYNNRDMDADLCFKVYGGDYDVWWTEFLAVLFLIVALFFCRLYFLISNDKGIITDSVMQTIMVGVMTFLLLCTFSVTGGFIDESDNFYGGMVVANGGCLYRDYVTQHTPVTYYLCSVFALLGAGSIEQFRLSYYFLESVLWGLLFLRHKNYFGRKTMILLPLLEVVCILSVVSPYGAQILSDGVQGFLTVVLLLEFLRYYEDRKLDWGRCIVISGAVWGSFGAAFISAYALIWVALVVLVLEIVYWIKEKCNLKAIICRYYRLAVSVTVPLVVAIIYFKANHSLQRAFDQFYIFNRVVYPKYTGGMGYSIVLPFIGGIRNFFAIITDNFMAIINSAANSVNILQLVLMVVAVAILIFLCGKKRYIESMTLLLVMCFSATRDYGFHGLAAWYVAIMIIALYMNFYTEPLSKIGKPLLGIFAIIVSSTYVRNVCDNLFYKQPSITDMEREVIALTEDETEEDIFFDGSSLYLFYKKRYPVNSAVFMFPWYMEWFEMENVQALKEKRPKVVLYDENLDTWGYTNYTIAFAEELKKNYKRLSENVDDDWKYRLWVRN